MISKGKVLIVDDDVATRQSLHWGLERKGYVLKSCSSAHEALAIMDKERWDIALIDIQLRGTDGLELLGAVRLLHPEILVIMTTSEGSVETAVRALKAGSLDYLRKPLDTEDLAHSIDTVLEKSRSRREVERLRENLREVSPKTDLVGESAAMKRVREQVETVAATDATVLIAGERGTGKEVVARAIHAGSPRRQMPMAVVRCGALTEALLEEELFGFEQPVREGTPRRKGKFEIADGGTVFLDEISEVSPRVQTDLLNVLETREIVRIGGVKPVRVDFRWIAASNASLGSQVKAGAFRADLYYRLNVFSIELPPLRERREDLPLLVNHFLDKHAHLMNNVAPPVSKGAMDLLFAYRWPGNVRELENSVERALLISRGAEIQPEHFPFQSALPDEEEGLSLRKVEQRHIQKVVEQSGWNLSRSARTLGIDRTTLYNKLRKYGLR